MLSLWITALLSVLVLPTAYAAEDNAIKTSGTRTVEKGGTLGRIAKESLPPGTTMNQMLVALYRANREAFMRGNINLVRAGVILKIPDAESVASVDSKSAKQFVQDQMSEFARYRYPPIKITKPEVKEPSPRELTAKTAPSPEQSAAAAPAVTPTPASAPSSNAPDKAPVDAGPYVPSPTSVVADMLSLAEVGPKDFVIDLGSGDGRIVLTAAKVFGARGFGVEIQDKLVKESNEAAKLQGLSERVRFLTQDLFKTDISKATVLTMYLLPNTVNMLKDKLLAELKPGTRIISHDYGLADWWAAKTITMDLEDKVAISGVTTTIIFLYKVPAKFAGNWSAKLPPSISKEPVKIDLTAQLVTRVRGKARIGGKDVGIEEGFMNGEILTFKLSVGGKYYNFTGTVKGNSIEGTVEGEGLKTVAWSAAAAK